MPGPSSPTRGDDEVVDEAAPPKRPRAKVTPLYAWAALAGISVALCLVVVISSARAPSSTPFIMFGAGGAGAGAAGAAVELAKRKLPFSGAAHATIALGVAFLVMLPAGAVKYTYGSTGSLAITLTVSPVTAEWESTALLSGEIAVYNEGATTVRLLPQFSIRLVGPSGAPLSQLFAQCSFPARDPPTEADFVEVPPTQLLQWPFTVALAYPGQNSAAQCGAFVVTDRGSHRIIGELSSFDYPAFALVPLWEGTLSAEPVAFAVR